MWAGTATGPSLQARRLGRRFPSVAQPPWTRTITASAAREGELEPIGARSCDAIMTNAVTGYTRGMCAV